MADYKKARILKRGLGQLDEKEMEHIGKLAKSLLHIQNDDFENDDFIQKPEGLERVKPQAKKFRTSV